LASPWDSWTTDEGSPPVVFLEATGS
jgi:hypothetical protein